MNLAELLCDRVRSTRSLAAVCAWRLRRLLTKAAPGPTPPPPANPPTLAAPASPAADRTTQARYIAQARAAITAQARPWPQR